MPLYKANPADRDQLCLIARGLLTENLPLGTNTSTAIGVDGTAYFLAVGLRAGDTVTGVALSISTAGAALTLSKVGLYGKTGTRLAISADLGTAWHTNGLKQAALTAPYVVAADDGYYLALITKGTTQPTWTRGGATTATSGAIGSGMGLYGTQAAQTDLPSAATIGFASSPLCIWAAAY